MPFQWIADNVTECAIEGLWTNSYTMVTVLHVRREEDDPEESARDLLNNWQDHILNQVPNNYVLKGCRFTDHNELEGATGFVLPDPAKHLTGQIAGQSASPNNCVLVHKLIDSHAGVRAGRMYLPPPAEAEVDENGAISGGLQAALATDLAAFHAGLSGAGSNRHVVVHKQAAGGGFSDASVVTGFLTDALVATQRRRIGR